LLAVAQGNFVTENMQAAAVATGVAWQANVAYCMQDQLITYMMPVVPQQPSWERAAAGNPPSSLTCMNVRLSCCRHISSCRWRRDRHAQQLCISFPGCVPGGMQRWVAFCTYCCLCLHLLLSQQLAGLGTCHCNSSSTTAEDSIAYQLKSDDTWLLLTACVVCTPGKHQNQICRCTRPGPARLAVHCSPGSSLEHEASFSNRLRHDRYSSFSC
jgi:hypothetical protein